MTKSEKLNNHFEKDLTNLPKNIREFKKYLPDITDTETVQSLFWEYAKHSDFEVSSAAKEILAFYKEETLKKLCDLDSKEQIQSYWLPMQAANNREYRGIDIA